MVETLRALLWTGLALGVIPSAACAQGGLFANGPLPPVAVPADNPQTDAKIRLGAQLYFDTRLSADNTISCATCHDPRAGWANPNPTDTGIGGQVGGRNSGTVTNSAYMRFQFWDGREESLEGQAVGPIHNPIEMGETHENVVRKLNAIPGYREQFQSVFGTDVTIDGIGKAIASFERTIVSGAVALRSLHDGRPVGHEPGGGPGDASLQRQGDTARPATAGPSSPTRGSTTSAWGWTRRSPTSAASTTRRILPTGQVQGADPPQHRRDAALSP